MAVDPVDAAVEQWARERPDLEGLDAMATIGRLGRLAALAGAAVDAGLKPYGLKVGEFDVLACLRRSGAPYELTPTALVGHLLLSSGAMTNRLDGLERSGLIRRRPDPDDRRGVLIGLTDDGRTLIDRAVEGHVANEQRILSGLSAKDRAALDRAVKKLIDGLSD